MAKTPLRYPGGKSRTSEILINYIPQFDEYREPFVGGASLFIKLKELYPNKKFWINDLYTDLYYFYKSCRYSSIQMIQYIQDILNKKEQSEINGKKLFQYAKYCLSDTSVQLPYFAAYFFIINRISFSGTTLSGGYSESAFQNRFTQTSINRLKTFCKLLKPKLRITNYDYEKVVMKDGKNVFIYLDPPYAIEKEALYGKNGNMHKDFDHERFANVLKKCKHKWLITYNDCDYIRKLFNFATIIPFEASYGMKNVNKEKINQKGNEIIIKNF